MNCVICSRILRKFGSAWETRGLLECARFSSSEASGAPTREVYTSVSSDSSSSTGSSLPSSSASPILALAPSDMPG
ncbi:hypothetical protein O181_067166 [Austropuccinia psidii MF-1]|uniref:Uncharacterized protein n=1 Tax=Austropuccinia psidii MF-1 TaxID=1389203 RepID=A0A9Q3EZ25_9BASI|nr:hypothetical protein [Austropuccinia psidii MF-1]